MIKKLSQKIFWIIMVSLSIVILGIIILLGFLNYTNTIKTSSLMLDRVLNNEPKQPVIEIEEGSIDLDLNIEGVYTFRIENSKIIKSSAENYDKTLEQYALKISNQNKEEGIINNYIYKVRKNKDICTVTLMENESVIKQTKIILLYTALGCIISVVIIYGIARRLSMVIVQPIEETFQKQKQFISDASHELKTPLAVIEANTDVLESEVGKNKWLDYIQNETESMNKLVNELLLLAKIENVDELKERKEFDLSKEIEIIISMFESMAYEKNVILKNNIQKNIIFNGSKEDLEHILSTLLDNAIKHTKASDEVVVDLKKEKGSIILQVKNRGDVIPENEREKIFERFYRVDKSRNRNEKRYGLGLAIAKSTVEKYNGHIDVNCKNGFTIFKVVIPA
jgi:signal transduction histidine kinase